MTENAPGTNDIDALTRAGIIHDDTTGGPQNETA